MRIKIFLFVIVSLAFASEVRGESDGLRIYLPRETAIKGDSIRLGDVGIICGDEVLVAAAGDVSLGKFRITGQRIVIDKQTILSRLACEGVKGKKVLFSGAAKVIVKRDEKVIPGERIVAVAREFADKQLGLYSVSSITAIGVTGDHALAEGVSDVELLVEPSRYNKKSMLNVIVKIVEEGIEIDRCKVSFAIRYTNEKVVAKLDIPRGAVISSDNVMVETYESSAPDSSKAVVPYGLVAKRAIIAGSVISDRLVGPLQGQGHGSSVDAMQPAVKRRQIVAVKIEAGGLSISSLGEALGDGRVGEYIKVKMGTERDSRTIIAKIHENGILKPVY
ncbi:MAG: flagella basal body P-ring formation protein FlgA [Planctomycetes bacterium]|nr:flagella basal body P-ring formation protein FlgA [Planctomycetota bacterium]